MCFVVVRVVADEVVVEVGDGVALFAVVAGMARRAAARTPADVGGEFVAA